MFLKKKVVLDIIGEAPNVTIMPDLIVVVKHTVKVHRLLSRKMRTMFLYNGKYYTVDYVRYASERPDILPVTRKGTVFCREVGDNVTVQQPPTKRYKPAKTGVNFAAIRKAG